VLICARETEILKAPSNIFKSLNTHVVIKKEKKETTKIKLLI
jgi:hypothetical protein